MGDNVGGIRAFFRRMSLRGKFLAVVLPLVLMGFLVFSLVSGLTTHSQLTREFREDNKHFVAVQSTILAEALWQLNDAILQRQMESFLLNSRVLGARLTTPDRALDLSVGRLPGPEDTGFHVVAKHIMYNNRGQEEHLGDLEVFFSNTIIQQALVSGFLRELLLILLMAMLVTGGAYWAHRVSIGQPLSRFLAAINSPDPAVLDQAMDEAGEDELGQVVRAHSRMMRNLRAGENALIRSEARFRSLAESTPAGIVIYRQGNILYLNPAAAEIFGYPPDSLDSFLGTEILEVIHPDMKDEVRDRFAAQMRGEHRGTRRYEFKGRKKDGSPIWIDIFVAQVDYDGRTADLGTFFDITERKRMQRELTRAMEEAQTASLAKTEFLASMSHELRTPMNAIVGMGELLAETRLSGEQQKYLQVFRSASENLINLIGDILDITKVESGRLELEDQPFRLADVLERAVETLSLKAHGKGIEFACLMDRDVPEWMVGDAVRLRQIVINLGGNAIKFTHQGEVVIRARLGEHEAPEGRLALAVEVSDSGVGIPPDKLETVFERFTQADSSTTREYGGVGLGLHITKRLAELMGGTVRAVSKPGEGSVFWAEVVLGRDDRRSAIEPDTPLAGVRALVLDDHWPSLEAAVRLVRRMGGEAFGQTEPMPALKALPGDFGLLVVDQTLLDMDGVEFVRRARETGWSGGVVLLLTTDQGRETMNRARENDIRHMAVKPVKHQEFQEACLGALNIAGEVRPEAEDAVASSPRSTILLVEDSEYNRLVVEAYLKDVTGRIVSARDGGEALERFREERFDLVLMDIQMPVMDGYEAIRRMRSLELETGADRTPIIALTAFALAEDADKCLAVGADAYLAKPVRKSEFLEVVGRFLADVALADPGADENGDRADTGPVEVRVDPALKRIVPGFLDFVRKAVVEVTSALERGDFETAEVLGHRMKGEGSAFGFEPVTEYGARIQRAGQDHASAELSVAVAGLAAYLNRLVVK